VRSALLAFIAALLVATPAYAQVAEEGQVVGEGQVITDMATEVEPPPGEDDGTDIPPVDDGTPAPEPEPDASGRRGEIHVLDARSSTSSPAAAPSAAAVSRRPATLPFTGVDALPLTLIGLALLASGLLLRRRA
jgi:hypothetical protein